MPTSLAAKIKEDFGSVEILRSEMLAMAYSMFGPGFVWLVRTEQKGDTSSIFSQRKFRLMCTYLAGSPLAGAHNRAQPLDMNTQNVAEAQAAGGLQGLSEQERSRQTNVQNSAGTMGAYAPRKEGVEKTSFGGVHIVPVLGVNTWQHAWLPDHGVGGKMTFLQKWWDLIDWNMVDSISATTVEASKPQFDAFSHGNSGRGNSANFHHS
jgi:Fe-Mn family superoxide dismutase